MVVLSACSGSGTVGLCLLETVEDARCGQTQIRFGARGCMGEWFGKSQLFNVFGFVT